MDQRHLISTQPTPEQITHVVKTLFIRPSKQPLAHIITIHHVDVVGSILGHGINLSNAMSISLNTDHKITVTAKMIR